MKKLVHIQMIK